MQDGIAFCTDCGQPMNVAPQQNFTQPVYTPYATSKKNKFDLVKLLGFIGAGVYMGAGVLSSIIEYDSDLSGFFDLMGALRYAGQGVFMLAIVFYMLHKMEK